MTTRRAVGPMTAVLWLTTIAGCSAMPAASDASISPPPSSVAPASPTASPTVAGSARATATAKVIATAAITPVPSILASPTIPDAGPPAGTLSAPDGVAVTGQRGSWCYGGQCLDVGTPPKRSLPSLTVPGGATLVFEVPPAGAFVHWSAWYAASAQGQPIVLAQGGSIFDIDAPPATPYPQLTSATFAAPAGGDWALVVELGFDGNAGGDASYYWRVVVP
jgi:hypothetical protein